MKSPQDMCIRGIIFDLDGTLLDTLGGLAAAMNQVLKAASLPTHEPSAYQWFAGNGIRRLVRRATPDTEHGEDIQAELVLAMHQAYRDQWPQHSKPFPGIARLLEDLGHRYRLGVLSNKPHAFTSVMVNTLLPHAPLDPVRGAVEDVPQKPDPTSALDMAASWKLNPNEVAFVGDTPIDVATAQAAGMLAVGVTWGFRPATELRAAGAQLLVDTPGEFDAAISAL